MRITRWSLRGGPPASSPLASILLLHLVSFTAAYAPLLNYAGVEARDSCPASYFSCEDQGSAFTGICCMTGQTCALDANNSPACCPSGSVCTGAAPTGQATATGTGTGTGTATTTSYATNSLYAFPAVATSFSNAAACSAAATRCATNYASCTSALEGATAYAVTIAVAGGGGVTHSAAALPTSSAVAVCQSLSSQACHGLSAARCATTGATAGGFYVGTAAGNAAGPRVTGAPCLAGVAAGLGVGLGFWGGAAL